MITWYKKFLILILISLILLIGSSFLLKPRVIEIFPKINQVPENLAENNDNIISILFVGDIMLNRGVEYMIDKESGEDFKFPFLKIAEDLKKADLLFGNLEGVISDKGYNVGSKYSFRAEPDAINGLVFAGFDIVSLANNHALDYTREALEDCFLKLKEAGIDYVGAGLDEEEAFSPIIKEINNIKVGFLAYTNLGPITWKATKINSGIAWTDKESIEQIKKDVESAKKEVDILAVSLHAGKEYSLEPDEFQDFFAKAVIDAGADLVIGHHPHVVQPIEKYPSASSGQAPSASSGQAGWIFYSLGNFIFDQDFSEETMRSQMIKVLIKNGEIEKVTPIDVKLNAFFQPYIETNGF